MKMENKEVCLLCMCPLIGISHTLVLKPPMGVVDEDTKIGPLCESCRADATKNLFKIFPDMRERGVQLTGNDENGELFERIVEVDEDGNFIPGRMHRVQ